MSLQGKIAYAKKVLPVATWHALRPRAFGAVHLIFALADHFEPAIDPTDGFKRVARSEQERRLEYWSREYPRAASGWRDYDGRPFVHTYFYPAEQYDDGLVARIADHCHQGWGEIEIHLHHGIPDPDTPENTERVLAEFRDHLAFRHRSLAAEESSTLPRYAFVHGNWALANSGGDRWCGVDSEMRILAATGCYADLTLPTSPLHPAQISKVNSLYECTLPLEQAAPHREGRDLAVGRAPLTFPLMVQGPLLIDLRRTLRAAKPAMESGGITEHNPMTLHRLVLWKRAQIQVAGRPDWLFIKLYCHSMNPRQHEQVLGTAFRKFLKDLVTGAPERKETLHFVTAREMTNIILAACDGREGNPGDFRDYRFRRFAEVAASAEKSSADPMRMKG